METNFKELLDNTNLTPIEILKYYEEEIANELEIYNNIYWSCLDFCKKDESLEQETKVTNLILEFAELIEYIISDYYKNISFPIVIREINKGLKGQLNYNPRKWADETKKDIKYIIQGLLNTINNPDRRIIERLNTSSHERAYIEEFYISELNRLLDEQEARIYELETENRQLKLTKALGDN